AYLKKLDTDEDRTAEQEAWDALSNAGKRYYLKYIKGGEEARVPRPARLVVKLPADARLTISGRQTRSTSGRRVFVSPPLVPGKPCRYSLHATFVRGGVPVVVTGEVDVRAGKTTKVTLPAGAAVAAR